jgi:hypothetical protein
MGIITLSNTLPIGGLPKPKQSRRNGNLTGANVSKISKTEKKRKGKDMVEAGRAMRRA